VSRPRTVIVSYTAVVSFDVPDDFPLSADEIRKTVEWKTNDYCDGRLPYSIEMMLDAANRAAKWQLGEAIFQHYCRRVATTFGASNFHIEGRNRLVARCENSVRPQGAEYEVLVDVKVGERLVDCPGCGQETPVSRKECCGQRLNVPPATSVREASS
jgi:hypothetical protein